MTLPKDNPEWVWKEGSMIAREGGLMTDRSSPKPDHRWNDPDSDGHNCVGCSVDSVWKCDRDQHEAQTILPDATLIENTSLSDPRELLTKKQQQQLDEALNRDAQARRTWLLGTLPPHKQPAPPSKHGRLRQLRRARALAQPEKEY